MKPDKQPETRFTPKYTPHEFKARMAKIKECEEKVSGE